jgi:hypothetical protein
MEATFRITATRSQQLSASLIAGVDLRYECLYECEATRKDISSCVWALCRNDLYIKNLRISLIYILKALSFANVKQKSKFYFIIS